jgi:hypothetical protein
MEIRTKFNVGDKIWTILRAFDGKWYMYIMFIVTQIIIDKYLGILYVRHNDCDLWCKEENCFATKEEAQKECDRRNGK